MNSKDTLRVRIANRTQETDEIISLELKDPDGAMLPPFSAGAHIDVHIGTNIVRQYSLCNSPSESHRYVIGVHLDAASRGGSISIHRDFHEGKILDISTPRNHFPLNADKKSLLIAGGIGVTPLLSMAEALHSAGTNFALHYCVRSRGKAAFLARIGKSPTSHHVICHYDDEDASQRIDLYRLFAEIDSDDEIYVCGPPGFIEWICQKAGEAGIPKQRVHYEYFSAHKLDMLHDQPFDVKIASTSQLFHIPANRSVASVLQEAGVEIYTSCGEGTCGVCATRILEGEPDHRDVVLTDEERASGSLFTPCCSRAKTSLIVLDI